MSVFFLPKGGVPSAFVPGATSITCSFAPADVLAANVKGSTAWSRLDGGSASGRVALDRLAHILLLRVQLHRADDAVRARLREEEVGEWEGVRAAE